jgi:hypothetical protein
VEEDQEQVTKNMKIEAKKKKLEKLKEIEAQAQMQEVRLSEID